MVNGFLQLRRGLIEHLTQGRIGPTECLLYVLISCLADPSTGIWRGSAGSLAWVSNINPRTCRDDLEKLESKGYVKRFQTPGSHENYPILVDKYECSHGAMKGKRLNSVATTDWGHPIYESCDESAVTVPGECRDGAGIKERELKIRKENTAARVPLAHDSEFFKITEKQDRSLAEAFPLVGDLPAEYRKMAAWLTANPSRRKRNHARFAHNWLARIPPPAPRTARPGTDDELDLPLAILPF